MKRIIYIIITLFILVYSLCGCQDALPDTATSSPAKTEEVQTVQEQKTVLTTTFADMPKIEADMVEVQIGGQNAVFSFIKSGLDSSELEVVVYSLTDDKLLSHTKFGDGYFTVSALPDGGFAVLDKTLLSFTYYGEDGAKTEKFTIPDIQSIDSAEVSGDGKTVLLQSYSDAGIKLYRPDTNKVTAVDTDEAVNSCYACGSNFCLTSTGTSLLDTKNEKTAKLDSSIFTMTANDTYACGIQGEYLVLVPLDGSEAQMCPITDEAEMIMTAGDGSVMTYIDDYQGSCKAFIYNAEKALAASFSFDGGFYGAAFRSDEQAVVITGNRGTNEHKFSILNFEDGEPFEDVTSPLNEDIINDVPPLPDPSGSPETVALITEIEQDYGVRFLYGDDIFDLSELNVTIEPTTEERAVDRMKLIKNFFSFYPDGLLSEAGLGKPLVIYLCDSVQPSAGGMNTLYRGYNITIISVGGNDDYVCGVLAHELGHALERGISPDVLSGWVELMPEDIIKVYNNGIDGYSVEYTPDDKGRTEVWFPDVYGTTNELEDRAVIFCKMYEVYESGDYGCFKYDGIKKKADYWSYMLRKTYDSCKNVTEFPWEKALKDAANK